MIAAINPRVYTLEILWAIDSQRFISLSRFPLSYLSLTIFFVGNRFLINSTFVNLFLDKVIPDFVQQQIYERNMAPVEHPDVLIREVPSLT